MTYFHKMSVVIFDQQFSGKRSRNGPVLEDVLMNKTL